MTYPRFFIYLALTTVVAALLAGIAHLYLDISYAMPLTVGMMVLMLVLSITIFILGKRTATADNKFLFGNVFMGATLVKMFACGGIVVAYILLAKPPGKMFIIPFFTTYFSFTVLEVLYLVILAGEGKKQVTKSAAAN